MQPAILSCMWLHATWRAREKPRKLSDGRKIRAATDLRHDVRDIDDNNNIYRQIPQLTRLCGARSGSPQLLYPSCYIVPSPCIGEPCKGIGVLGTCCRISVCLSLSLSLSREREREREVQYWHIIQFFLFLIIIIIFNTLKVCIIIIQFRLCIFSSIISGFNAVYFVYCNYTVVTCKYDQH